MRGKKTTHHFEGPLSESRMPALRLTPLRARKPIAGTEHHPGRNSKSESAPPAHSWEIQD